MSRANRTQTFIPATIRFRAGNRTDLTRLARHHYRSVLPATSCVIRVAFVRERHTRRERVIGVAVLSWPVPMLAARNRHFRIDGYGNRLRFANENVRTISRVIVHPQFRAAGIAQDLVRQLVERCPTRYVESSTHMGAFAGFLRRCGFQSLQVQHGEPAYFLFDRSSPSLDRSATSCICSREQIDAAVAPDSSQPI